MTPVPWPVVEWLQLRYLGRPNPERYLIDGAAEPVVVVPLADLAGRLAAAGVPVVAGLDALRSAGWTYDMQVELRAVEGVGFVPADVLEHFPPGPGDHRAVGIRAAVVAARPARRRDKPTVDELLYRLLNDDRDFVMASSLRKVARRLGCSHPALLKSPAWKAVERMREQERAARKRPGGVVT